MIVYNMNQTLQVGDTLTPDYRKMAALSRPFVKALEESTDCFYAMFLNGQYLDAVLDKFKMWAVWTNYTKWAVEGAFEFIRKTEFSECCSRVSGSYFYGSLEESDIFYQMIFGRSPQEIQEKVRFFAIELEDTAPMRVDMRLFDEAYNAMDEIERKAGIQTVFDCARRYFRGEQTEDPVWELLSDRPARAVEDVTDQVLNKIVTISRKAN